MVNILVLGGTGPTGIALIREALQRGHTLVIFARSPHKLPPDIAPNPAVVIIQGTLEDEDAIERAFTVHKPAQHGEGNGEPISIEVVISALGPPVKGFHPRGAPIARAYERFISVAKRKHTRRFIVLGTASIRDDNDKADYKFSVLTLGVGIFAPYAYSDVTEIGKVFRAENPHGAIAWTIARVPLLGTGNNAGYNAGYIGDGVTGTYLNRSAYACFVCDTILDTEWVGKMPMISNS